MPIAAPADAAAASRPGPAPAPGRREPAERRRNGGRLLIVAALAVAIVPLLAVLDDPDLWWHLRNGHLILDQHVLFRSDPFAFTDGGTAAVFHEWGAEVLFAVLDSIGGLLLLSVVTCLLSWSGLVALALRARDRGAPPAAIAVAILLAARVLEPVSGPRPQMLGFALLCWTMLLAERFLARGGRLVWCLPGVLLLWANLHGGFIYGVGVLGAVTVIEAVRARLVRPGAAPASRVRTLGIVTVASAAAACVNPYGPGLYWFSVTAGRIASREPIAEWQPPNLHDSSSYALFVLVAAWVLLGWAGRRGLGLHDALLGTAGVASSLLAIRNSELAVALALPGLAVVLGVAWKRLPSGFRTVRLTLRPASVALVGAGIATVLGIGVERVIADSRSSAEAAVYPACAARVLAAVPGDIRIHADYADAGYLIERDWPHLRVYDYGGPASLAGTVLDDDIRISSGTTEPPSALSMLDSSGTNAVLTASGGPLDTRLAASGTWHLAAVDHGRDLWLAGAATGGTPAAC
jgi:hypothetical protein